MIEAMSTEPPEIGQKPGPESSLVVQLTKDLNDTPPLQPGGRAGLTIRSMHASPGGSDRDDVLDRHDIAMWLTIQNEAFSGRPRPWTRADFRRELERRSWFRPEQLWLAGRTDGPFPVGTIALELSEESLTGRIHWLAVSGRWRRRGVGKILVERLEWECWRQGGRRVVLETLGSWHSVMSFYESLGYRVDDVSSVDG